MRRHRLAKLLPIVSAVLPLVLAACVERVPVSVITPHPEQ